MRGAIAAATVVGLLVAPRPAISYDASIGWQPRAGASGYMLYVRYGATGTPQPTDVGLPSADADGLVRVLLGDLPLGPATYFWTTAYDASRTESAVSQTLSITYAAAAAVSDSDADGLTNAEEDADLDGKVDPGETDLHDADSDGDGVTDGRETLIHGTDPLDAGSIPPCTGDCSTSAICGTTCDDTNPCTLDLCERGECVHLSATASCDDGLGCTTADVCAQGACAGADTCGDGSVCDLTAGACRYAGEVWIAAAAHPNTERRGAMTSDATYAGGNDADPAADSLAAELVFPLSTSNSLSGGSGDEVRYQVSLPSAGPWYLWGRFYWPGAAGSNDANSFVARIDGGAALKFGNNRDYYRRWHWGGDGAVDTGTPQPLALGQLSAGAHVLVIEKREAVPVPPRLDVLVLTRDPAWRPSDTGAVAALADLLGGGSTTTTSVTTTTTTLALPPPGPTTTTTLPPQCSNAGDCGDTNPCTTDTCAAGKCVHTAATSGSCDDADPCTVGDACAAGACVGWPLDCSHLDGSCTRGVCDPQRAECSVARFASGTACDDGSACTAGDVCTSGQCSGAAACASGTFCESATKTCKQRTEVWVPAAGDETATFGGAMTSDAAYTGGNDADAAADSLEPFLVFAASSANNMKATSADKVTYDVYLPVAGQWYAWGRFYYPGTPGSNDANSFYIGVDSGTALKFGNNRSFFRRWHWGGDGRFESGTPIALSLGQLTAGSHALTISKREVTPVAPRLDVLVLTQDPAWIPTDAAARTALEEISASLFVTTTTTTLP